MIQNLFFLEISDSMHVFFQNIALKNKLSKKVGKRQLWHFNGVKWQKKRFFEIKLSKKAWCFETSLTWKSVALLKFPSKTWCVVKKMFQNLTRCKVSDTKMTGWVKLTKNLLLLKDLIRIWRIVENFFQDLIFCKSPARKTVFFQFFLQELLVFWKRMAANFFWGKTIQKYFSESRSFIKICFFKKTISLQNLARCKTSFRNLKRSKIFRFEFCRVVKKRLQVWRIRNSWFKIWRVLQQLIQKLNIFKNFDTKKTFIKKKKQFFQEQLFQDCTKS